MHCWSSCSLQDDAKLLRDYHITAASRILVTKGAGAAAQQALAGGSRHTATCPLHTALAACREL